MRLPPRRLLSPPHWLAWLTISIFWSLSHLPYRWQLPIGRWLGRQAPRVATGVRHVTEVNLQLCFPDWTSHQRTHLLKNNFEACGISLMETAMGWWASDDRLRSLFTIRGLEYLRAALRNGKGVILCSAHFLSMELAGRFLMMEIPFAAVYRPQKHPVLNWVSYRCRCRHYDRLLAHDDIRGVLAALRENQVVWYTADIDPGRKRTGVFAPFFGVPAYTGTGVARLARVSGANVVPGFPYRRKDGSGYDLVLGPPLDRFPSHDRTQDAARVNEIIEQAIGLHPDQYLWQYKRFKTRQPGAGKLYERPS